MPWLEISIELREQQCAVFERVLLLCGAQAVTYRDAADHPVLEPTPGSAPLWPNTRLTALFPADEDVENIAERLREQLGDLPLPPLQTNCLDDEQWERKWLADFQPMLFGSRLWVCPAGANPPDKNPIIVRLDPGLAFGTGTHPTTALCLRWLDQNPLQGFKILDYGCGSGILAIAALRLGAHDAVAADLDPQALTATRQNAERNEVADRLRVIPPALLPTEEFDVVIANILAAPLIELAPRLAKRVRPGGHLVLSGLLSHQADAVRSVYGAYFKFTAPEQQDEWLLLEGERLRLVEC